MMIQKNNDFFRKHIHFELIDSTHGFAKKNLNSLENGTVITADYQAGGKGRYDRKWFSSKGKSLLSTIVIKRQIAPESAGLLTLITALTVSQILEDYKIESKIRWPNDVVVNGKKIAGILAEAVIENSNVSSVILSLGLNLAQGMEEMANIDRPATSIFLESSIKTDCKAVLNLYLKKMSENLDIFFKTGFDGFAFLIRERAELIGKTITLKIANEHIDCRVLDYSKDGAMKVEDSKGNVRNFFAGEVERIL